MPRADNLRIVASRSLVGAASVGRDSDNQVVVNDGTISGPGNGRTSYWELAGDLELDRDATPGAKAKLATRRAVAGHSVQRIDIPDASVCPYGLIRVR